MKKRKESKELKALREAISNYYDKHKGNCVITCSVFAFDEEYEVIDDRMWIVGYAPCVKIDHEEIGKIIEAGDFSETWYE
jgi:hypothetical protein